MRTQFIQAEAQQETTEVAPCAEFKSVEGDKIFGCSRMEMASKRLEITAAEAIDKFYTDKLFRKAQE